MEFSVERRSKIVTELINTESAYLDHLNLILKYFVDPLLCSRLIPAKDVSTIFGDIRSIRLLNQVLLDHLRLVDVAGAFSQLIHFLKLYSAYARNFPSSQSLLTRLIDNDGQFRNFVEKQETLPGMRGLKLPALLITPIQRIPRYKLLLEQLYAATDGESEKKRELFCILQQINEVAEQINNCVEDFDNCNQIISLQRCLDGCTPKLLTPGRKLLKSGQLVKVKCKTETLILVAAEYGILDGWVNALETAIKNLLDNRRTLRKESSSSNPLRRNILKAKRQQRQHSSLSEKVRQQNCATQQTKLFRERPNSSSRFLTNVRKRVLKFVRKRSTISSTVATDCHVTLPVLKKRRVVMRSPILSIVEEEELKRVSGSNTSGVKNFADSPDFHSPPVKKFSKQPWWEEETSTKTSHNTSGKKSRCCFNI